MGRWEIKKFSGNNDFGLWKIKMQALFIQEKCIDALKSEVLMNVSLTQVQKTEMVDKARSVIILCLGDKVLREVTRDEFSINQGIKMHVTAELLLSFWGKVEVKSAYLVGREFLQKKNSENQGRKSGETITEKTQFEVEFPTMGASSSEGTVTEIFDYHLTHDKVRRVIVTSQRDDYTSLGYYVFIVADGLQNKRRKIFREAFENRWSQGWLKNHTCRLVKLPWQKRVIGNKWMQVARSKFKGCLN